MGMKPGIAVGLWLQTEGFGSACPLPSCLPTQWWGAAPVGSRVGRLLHKELLGNQKWIQAGQGSCSFIHSFIQ